MRPDEHKKRKSAQYKKKHGMKTDSKQQCDTKTGDKQVKGVKHAGPKQQESDKQESRNRKVVREETDSSDEEEKSYRRRQLVSNWSRYDDIPSDDDDDIPLQRGEDFNKLLAEAGGSAAQFRFKDEEDWSGDVDASSANLLALDLENIAQSLMCVPLHERLGISQDLFTTEQLAEIQSSAEECQRKYDHSTVTTTRFEQSVVTQSESTGTRHISQGNPETKTPLATPTCASKDTLPKSETDKTVVKSSDTSVPEKGKGAIKSAEIASLEDDLDMLLSMDEPVKDSVNLSRGPSDNMNKNTEVKEMPEIQQVPCVSKESKTTEKPAVGKVSECAKGDNLEDWLDSMLDD